MRYIMHLVRLLLFIAPLRLCASVFNFITHFSPLTSSVIRHLSSVFISSLRLCASVFYLNSPLTAHLSQTRLYASALFLFIGLCAYSQQLDQIGKKDALKLNGGLNINQMYRSNAASGVDPYALVVTGNLAANLYGMSIPVSFTWSNQNWTYTQPFNQFSISPSYKWATLHLGYSSMSFSPYSLSGHTFAGAGIDLNPTDKLKFSAMYGRLRKALPGDTTSGFDPQYKRMGTGMKASYTFKNAEVGVHLFHGQDDTDKPFEQIDSLGITPMENMVLGSTFMLRPWQRLTLRGEVSVSSLSRDRRISGATDFNGAATHRYHAAKSDISWSTSIGSIGAGIEYVEPGYETLGAYYTVNDFVNYTLNLATVMIRGKVTMAANVGIRQTNLDNQSDTDQKDIIQNFNVGFTPGEKFNLSASYSNFYNYTHIQTVFEETNTHTEYELLDTLTFTQINENISLSANWQIKKTETVKHTLNGNVNFQQASQNQSDAVENADSRFINASGGYSWARPKQNLSLGLNMNYSRNKTSAGTGEAYGPIFFVRKSLFDKKWRNSLSVSWNGTYMEQESTGHVLTARLGSNYALKKKHLLNLSLAYSRRDRPGSNSSYVTASMGYSYRFGWPKSGEK
ncbi:MAG: outer membrane beta-barrel family protein [Bacteroidales bacterium]|nr:outer membrane beta-barrel family protein [Bacteroidales bacterium]